MYGSLFDQLRLFPGSNRERLRHGLVGELRALDGGLIGIGQERASQLILAPGSLSIGPLKATSSGWKVEVQPPGTWISARFISRPQR